MFDTTWLVVLATLTNGVNLSFQYYFIITYIQLSTGFMKEKGSESQDSVNSSDHKEYYNHLTTYHLFEAAVQIFLTLLSVIIGNSWTIICNLLLLCWNINKIIANTYFSNDIESSVGLKFRVREALVKLFIHLAMFYFYLTDMVPYRTNHQSTT